MFVRFKNEKLKIYTKSEKRIGDFYIGEVIYFYGDIQSAFSADESFKKLTEKEYNDYLNNVNILSHLQFRNLFTLEEKMRMLPENYKLIIEGNDDIPPDDKLKTIQTIAILLEDFTAATEINLYDQRTLIGLNLLETVGILEPGRLAEIIG